MPLDVQEISGSAWRERIPGLVEYRQVNMVPISKYTALSRVIMTGFVFWSFAGVPVYADDDYLSALEAEANDTGTRSDVPVATAKKQARKVKSSQASEVIEPGLGFEEFEEELSAGYSGSHLLYIKLSKGDRKAVYKFYQSNNRISSIREEIVRRLSSG